MLPKHYHMAFEESVETLLIVWLPWFQRFTMIIERTLDWELWICIYNDVLTVWNMKKTFEYFNEIPQVYFN
jgi:hypothetical protein